MLNRLQPAIHRILAPSLGCFLIHFLIFLFIFQGLPTVQLALPKILQSGRLLSIVHQLSTLVATPPVYAGACAFDDDGDNDVDGSDLQVFAESSFSPADLSQFAMEFGSTDCSEDLPPDPAQVAPDIDSTVASTMVAATAFLYSGQNPIQAGVLPGTIEDKRVAVIRGQVSQRDGSPLSGVTISVHAHPEYGTTLSRADGRFDLAVNGGGQLTIEYSKSGYLMAQRNVTAPWQDYVWVDEVVLIRQDSVVTTVNLNDQDMHVARGSVVSDNDGSRQGFLLIPQGTHAEIYLPDGSTQPVDSLNIRITEFTVGDSGPAAMPAGLPPASAYTYAMALSADEATVKINGKDVLFNQPVYYYVENFLDFPTGTIVPVGYYDDDNAVWVPSDNALVIKILGITDGMADIDVEGSSIPADAQTLADLGFSDAERVQLAVDYSVGQSLWRIPLTHLSTWDANWSWGPSPDAQGPEFPLIDWLSDMLRDDPEPCSQKGSIIECQNQVLGEVIPVAGTPFSLHYSSDRVPGRKFPYTLEIPISGDTLPDSLKRIDLEIYVAGQEHKLSFSPLPNQSYTFTWDGKDAYGRRLQGSQPISFRLGYVYDGYYQAWSGLFQAFGEFGSGIPISANPSRGEFIMWQEWSYFIGGWDARSQGLGGWNLSVHHAYDPGGRILYPGYGGRRKVNAVSNVINTVAGGGSSLGDNGPATEAQLVNPSGLAIAPDGTMYIADRNHHSIRKISPDGTISTFVAGLNSPEDVALGPDGSIYIADTWNHRILKVSPDGSTVTTVAGSGVKGFCGDGGPAQYACFFAPAGIAVGQDGSLYIADRENNRIRKVSPNGIITTIAGTGDRDYTGDGGLATEATFKWPSGIAVGPDGTLYIADHGNKAVRRIGVDGIITTFATYNLGYFQDIDISGNGDLYVATNGLAIRVSPDGVVHPLAGENCCGFGGDGGPALPASLSTWCNGIAVGPDGFIYLSDTANHRVRAISPPYPAFGTRDIAIPSEDGRLLYQFDPEGRHLATVNALNGETIYSFQYDSNGLLIQITDAYNNITIIERDGHGNPTAIVAPFGQSTVLTMNNDYLGTITDPASQSYSFTYDAGGLMQAMTDPRGNSWAFEWDSDGRLIKDTDPDQGFTELSRMQGENRFTVTTTTAENRVNSYRSEALPGAETQKTITFPDGPANHVLLGADFSTQVTYADGTEVHQTRDGDPRFSMQAPITSSMAIDTPAGLAYRLSMERTASFTDPTDAFTLETLTDTVTFNGRTFTRTYTAGTKAWTNVSPMGRQTVTTVDNLGRVTETQVTGLEPHSLSYDSHGRIAQAGQGIRMWNYGYDASSGYLKTVTNPLNEITSFARDNVGRLTSLTMPDATAWEFFWDENSNLTSLTEPDGTTRHQFSYTKTNLLASYESPLHAVESFEHDKDGRLITRTYPSNKALGWIYNTAGQLTTFSTPEGNHVFTYNADSGLMNRAVSRDGQQVDYSYDGNLLTAAGWSGVVSESVSYSYDNDLRVSQLDYATANLSITYDEDGLITCVGSINLSRDTGNGLLTGVVEGGFQITYGRNSFGEINSVAASHGGALYGVSYSYDDLGRMAQKVETIGATTHTWDYAYDRVGQLVTVKKDGVVVESYGYDAVGNRIGINNSLTGRNLTAGDYNYDADNKLLAAGSTTYSYDADGRLGQVSGEHTYHYNTDGTLASVTLADGRVVTYKYDHRGRRITRGVDGSRTHAWLYGQGLMPLAEYDGSGNLRTVFIYAGGATPVTMIRNSVTYHIVSDHLASPRLVVDNTGIVVKQVDYDSFGNVIYDSNPAFDLPFGFAGGMADPDHELIRFGARDYQPSTGRWTAKDPILFGGGALHLYGYVGNDPVNHVDSTGLKSILDILDKLRRQREFYEKMPTDIIKNPHNVDKYTNAYKDYAESTVVAGSNLGKKGTSMVFSSPTIPGKGIAVVKEVVKDTVETKNKGCQASPRNVKGFPWYYPIVKWSTYLPDIPLYYGPNVDDIFSNK